MLSWQSSGILDEQTMTPRSMPLTPGSFEYEIWVAVMTAKYSVPLILAVQAEDVKALCARYGSREARPVQ